MRLATPDTFLLGTLGVDLTTTRPTPIKHRLEAVEQTALIAPGAVRRCPPDVEVQRLNLFFAAVAEQVLTARVMTGLLPEEPKEVR